jgi:hypothetical protein
MTAHGSRRETQTRHEQAAKLRACGRTWQEIADDLGYRSRQGAQLAVARLYDRHRESPDLSRRSMVDGLRLVKSMLFEELASAKSRHDTSAIVALSRELRSNADQVARLDGLHAPQRLAVDVTVSQSPSQIIAEAQERLLAVIDAEVIELPREIAQ